MNLLCNLTSSEFILENVYVEVLKLVIRLELAMSTSIKEVGLLNAGKDSLLTESRALSGREVSCQKSASLSKAKICQ